MVTTLRERAHNKLTMLPDGDKLAFQGGIPVLTGEKALELYEPYLQDVGRVTFLRKIEEETFSAEDLTDVAQFLMKHNIQPTVENCFGLVMGARLHLLFTAGS